jgi:hypothetical protein
VSFKKNDIVLSDSVGHVSFGDMGELFGGEGVKINGI